MFTCIYIVRSFKFFSHMAFHLFNKKLCESCIICITYRNIFFDESYQWKKSTNSCALQMHNFYFYFVLRTLQTNKKLNKHEREILLRNRWCQYLQLRSRIKLKLLKFFTVKYFSLFWVNVTYLDGNWFSSTFFVYTFIYAFDMFFKLEIEVLIFF